MKYAIVLPDGAADEPIAELNGQTTLQAAKLPNMDWIAAVLRRLIEYTQAGGEVNIIVMGINVGGQPYWNAEATMLMHTRGILIMTPEGAMVLTGKTALDYSGSVSAEDNQGIGGYEHIMGPNGQAQYWAPDLGRAIHAGVTVLPAVAEVSAVVYLLIIGARTPRLSRPVLAEA